MKKPRWDDATEREKKKMKSKQIKCKWLMIILSFFSKAVGMRTYPEESERIFKFRWQLTR